MALDFPSNPVDGEIFGSYTWSSSKGVWQSREESATVAIMSPTKPPSASNGDIWVNTNDGTAFAYYDDGSSTQWIELVNSAIPAAEENMPTATIVQTARATAPIGWLICDGSAVSRSTYAQLYNAIGTNYGSGDGSTTFNLPNLKGRVPVGLDFSQTEFDTLGETSGSKTHTLTINEMPSHTHTQNAHNHTQDAHGHAFYGAQTGQNLPFTNTGNVWTHFLSNYQYSQPAVGSATATNQATVATNQNTGGGLAHNNLQPYIVLNYMIKV